MWGQRTFWGAPRLGRKSRASGRNLVILAGQSNAVGFGDTGDLTDSSYADTYSNVRTMWQVATSVTNPPNYNTGELQSLAPIQSNLFGLDASLGRALDEAGGRWDIAKFALAGTSFVDHWLPDSTYPTSDPDGINLYTRFINFVKSALANTGSTLKAIVWVHGEADTRATDGPQNYADNMVTFVNQVREDLGVEVPFVFGRLNDDYSWTAPEVNACRAMQESLRALLPSMSMVNQDTAALAADNVHYTADGYVDLGELYAAKILAPDARLTDYTVDATSGDVFPANATEEAAFRIANELAMPAPTSIFGFQDASGGVIDANGVRDLSEVGTLTYDAAVTGQARKGVSFPSSANTYVTNNAVPNRNASSGLLIMVAVVTDANGLRNLLAVGVNATDAGLFQLATGVLRADGGGGTADGLLQCPFGVAAAYGYHHDYSQELGYGFHDTEALEPTYAAMASSTRIWYGSTGGTSSAMVVTYGLWWEGIRAEAAKGCTPSNIKAYLNAMGIAQTWVTP